MAVPAEEVIRDLNNRANIMDDIEKITNAFNNINPEAQGLILACLSLSEDKRKVLRTKITTNQKPAYNPPELPKKDGGGYQTLAPYVRMDDKELIDFVNDNWGDYLASHNPNINTDIITRSQLRAYDTRLMNRLEKLDKNRLLTIIQTETKKTGDVPKLLTEKEFKQAVKIVNNYYKTNSPVPT